MAESTTIARPYAEAAFRIARDNNAFPAWSQMLALVSTVTADAKVASALDNPRLNQLLDAPRKGRPSPNRSASQNAEVRLFVSRGPTLDSHERDTVWHSVRTRRTAEAAHSNLAT